MEILVSVLSSTVIATIISSYILKSNNDKTLSLKYITEERSAWRKLIKETTSKICSGSKNDELRELTTILMLSLNPLKIKGNELDLYLIDLLKQIEKGDPNKQLIDEFRDHIGILLKHDWERSKNETKSKIDRQTDSQIKSRTLGRFYNEQKSSTK